MGPDEYVAAADEVREAYLKSLDDDGLLQMGIDLYNTGHFWHAHEAWEEVWMDAPRELRHFYQGLIQVAAAFVHLTRGEYPGTVKLIAEGVRKLESYPARSYGVDLGALIAGARSVQSVVEVMGERRLRDFDRRLIPRIERNRADGPGSKECEA